MPIENDLKTQPKKSLLLRLMLGSNSFVLLLLIASYGALYINPNSFWLIALCGIAYPYVLLLNLIFVIFWLIFRPKYAIYSAVFIMLGYGQITKLYQFSGKVKPKKTENLIKVMSYNVRLFDLYNYNKDWSFNFNGRNIIFNFIRKENPDIACFQEYFYDSSNKFCTTDSLTSILKTDQVFTYFPQVLRKTDYYGIAIYSRYPIINSGVIDFKQRTNNSAIFVDIQKGNSTYRVYNTHLQSIRFGKDDYAFTQNLEKQDKKPIDINKSSQKILYKLKNAYKLRAEQSLIIAEHIAKSPYPVILCGDFNDTPTSFSYHHISNKLIDCFVESGSGFGTTYSGEMPSFRIDYIFHDKHFKGYEFTTHQSVKASDHYPITVWLKEGK